MAQSELKVRLAALGVSQKEFAARVGVSEQTVVAWHKGIPPVVRAYLNLYENVHTIVEMAGAELDSQRRIERE